MRTGARRWHTGFVDAAGIGGLLAQVEGRTSAATFAWLKAQPASWRSGITHVTIDLSASYAKAAREALPDAVLVADSGSGRSGVQIRHTHPGATSVPYTCPNLRKLTASRGLTRCPPLARSSCRTQRIRHIKLVPKLTVRVRFPSPAPHTKSVAAQSNSAISLKQVDAHSRPKRHSCHYVCP